MGKRRIAPSFQRAGSRPLNRPRLRVTGVRASQNPKTPKRLARSGGTKGPALTRLVATAAAAVVHKPKATLPGAAIPSPTRMPSLAFETVRSIASALMASDQWHAATPRVRAGFVLRGDLCNTNTRTQKWASVHSGGAPLCTAARPVPRALTRVRSLTLPAPPPRANAGERHGGGAAHAAAARGGRYGLRERPRQPYPHQGDPLPCQHVSQQ